MCGNGIAWFWQCRKAVSPHAAVATVPTMFGRTEISPKAICVEDTLSPVIKHFDTSVAKFILTDGNMDEIMRWYIRKANFLVLPFTIALWSVDVNLFPIE